jgi:signal transduction histidine kinase
MTAKQKHSEASAVTGNRSSSHNQSNIPARRDQMPDQSGAHRPVSGADRPAPPPPFRSDAQQWHRVVDALGVIASLIRERKETDDLAGALIAGAAQAIGADMAILRIADVETRILKTTGIHGFDQQLRQSLIGTVSSLYDSQTVLAKPGSSLFAFSEGAPRGFTQNETVELTRRGITHALCVPLLNQGVLIGRLDLMTACGSQFTTEQQTVSEALGAVIASTLSEGSPDRQEMNSKVTTARLNPPSFEDISDAREMFQYLVQWIDEMIGAEQCYGFIWNETKETFLPVAVSGGQPDAVQALKEIHLRPEAVPALREAIHSETPYVIPDARDTSLLPPEMAAALDLQQVAILSLRGSAGQLVGSVLIDFTEQHELSDSFLNVVIQAGNYTSIMLENALLYEAVQRSSENLAIVNEIGIELATLSDLDSLFRIVFYHVRSVMETTCFAVGLTLPDGKHIEYRYAIENRIASEPVILPLGKDALSRVIQTRKPQIASDPAMIQNAHWFPIFDMEDTLQSAIAVPIVVGHDTIGVLTAQSESMGSYEIDALNLLVTVGMQLGAAIQNARLYAIVHARDERRGYLLDQVITQQETERKMLVDDIHNHTLQTLAHCLFQLDMTRKRTGELSVVESQQEISRVRDTLSANVERLRETIFQLRPSTLDILGLESALREYFKHFQDDTGVRAELEIDLPDRFDNFAETRVYRLVQEAVDTIRHRSEVTRIVFRVRQRDNDVLVTIADDGQGVGANAVLDDTTGPLNRRFSDAERRLITLRERAELAGGTLHLTHRSNGGSLIQVVIPYRGDE